MCITDDQIHSIQFDYIFGPMVELATAMDVTVQLEGMVEFVHTLHSAEQFPQYHDVCLATIHLGGLVPSFSILRDVLHGALLECVVLVYRSYSFLSMIVK